MENKIIACGDIRKQFASFLKILVDVPFNSFFDNEKICPDKFAVLFNYLEPTLPIFPYITMLRTENPYVTVPFFMNNPFFDYEKNKDGLKIISFCNWVGYYTGSTSFNEDFIVKNDTIKNYSLMYKYLNALKNCVSIIDDFFLMLDAPKNYLNPIYKSISVKTVKILTELMGFYGNYILVKKKGVSRYLANDRLYIRDTQPNTPVVYNSLFPVTAVGTDNPLFPVTADLTRARGGEGTNFFETIPHTRFNNIAAEIISGDIEGEFDRTLRENAHRVVAECTELLRAAT
uniref:Uncharacterized protein n=1 Tax=Siphoviridae sp. ctLqe90 TaxID=2825456 RepID=A0A8S5Q2X4_9CAUD|nr:MAG TPA: hypothetical protein [Siphoviridae sp. ctLqe90]